MAGNISLTRYLVEQQRTNGRIPSQLRLLLEVVARSCKSISHAVNKGLARFGGEAFTFRGAGPSPGAHHLYLCDPASAEWRRHLLFRDALRADAALATEYAALKRRMANLHAEDPDAYTEAKTEFVEAVLRATAKC